jgi:hypothetical protein
MAEAWIRGKSAALDVAIAEAASLLAASRLPVIAGLGTDVAGLAPRSNWRKAWAV